MSSLRQVLDETDQLVSSVALVPSELHELFRSGEHKTLSTGATGDGDAASTLELEQSLLAKNPQCAKHRVGVDTEHRSEIACRWQLLAGERFAVCNRAADVAGHLVVEERRVGPVNLDGDHGASDSSSRESASTAVEVGSAPETRIVEKAAALSTTADRH